MSSNLTKQSPIWLNYGFNYGSKNLCIKSIENKIQLFSDHFSVKAKPIIHMGDKLYYELDIWNDDVLDIQLAFVVILLCIA